MAEQQTVPGAEDPTGRLRRHVTAFVSPDRWQTPLAQFEHSGYAFVEQVRSWQPRFVVDVGCEPNPFKGKIDNLIGIDLVNRPRTWCVTCSMRRSGRVPSTWFSHWAVSTSVPARSSSSSCGMSPRG